MTLALRNEEGSGRRRRKWQLTMMMVLAMILCLSTMLEAAAASFLVGGAAAPGGASSVSSMTSSSSSSSPPFRTQQSLLLDGRSSKPSHPHTNQMPKSSSAALPSWLLSMRWISSSSRKTTSTTRQFARHPVVLSRTSTTATVSTATATTVATTRKREESASRQDDKNRRTRQSSLTTLHLLGPSLLGSFSALSSSASRQQQRQSPPARRGRRANSISQLFMGIRSILGFGGKKDNKRSRSDGDDDSRYGEDEDLGIDDDGTISSAHQQQASSSFPLPLPLPPPLRMGEDPVSKEVNVLTLDHRETTQEKINRVKAGYMTEAEKKAFLQTALTAGNTAESRRPLLGDGESSTNGNAGAKSGTGGNGSKRFFASPFPSDSILRNFARGGPKSGGGGGIDSSPASELDSQKKKREYLDMVTDPDRFKRRNRVSPNKPAETDESSDSADSIEVELSVTLEVGDSDITSTGSTTPQVQPITQTPTPSTPSNLGARLGMAAMANESIKRQQEQERKKELQWRLDVERKQHEQRAKELNEWQQKMAGFEAQQRELRAKEEERRMKQEAEKKKAEKARLEHLVKAQEEYWEKKLARERAARLKQNSQDTQEPAVSDTEVEEETAGATIQEDKSDSTPVNEKAPSSSQKTLASSTFNPDESDLLNLARKDRDDDWEENQERMEVVKAETLGVKPSFNTIQTEEDFLEEQARKKREIDRKREEQMERLRALNSPLPSPAPGHRPPPPVFRPQVEVRPKMTAAGPSSSQGGRGSNTPTTGPGNSQSIPISSAASASGPSVARVEKPKSQPSLWGAFNFGGKISPSAPPSNTPAPSSSSPSPPSSKPAPAQANGTSPTVRAAAKPGPIRMKLPLGDDAEDGVDVRANKRMSIADAMKRTSGSSSNQAERSKKWGIDMSKFADD